MPILGLAFTFHRHLSARTCHWTPPAACVHRLPLALSTRGESRCAASAVGSNQAARRQMAAGGSRTANRKSTESTELATPSAARIWDEFEPSISAV
jgi:hypothetical protein